ncbi:GNAT family N-acetyltransferase [Bythopirellula polymerisocia]|uniref:Acetyltransferase (GNAT) family protein n=1 Tax=Bythopirellula polymerisocia TaxID=2528003 RepID=A0A5C6CZ69_9BACT|nr:GNAT family N-acetyltransferase [Bythopirellula polymerisocia]TWU29932.1 Acetyltransferase (GNAT) family protein [Bythopirellula polymerisocia]
MHKLHIRPGVAGDAELIYTLISELAEYEKLSHEVVATPDSLRESIFSPNSASEVLIAELDDQPVGFALFFTTYSTFLAKEGIYLEDVYVRPAFRGRGVGKQLLAEVARITVQRGGGRFEWSVLDWNTPAIEFYDSLGAKPQGEWIRYRIVGNELEALAGS